MVTCDIFFDSLEKKIIHVAYLIINRMFQRPHFPRFWRILASECENDYMSIQLFHFENHL